jgi:hypothetical protein
LGTQKPDFVFVSCKVYSIGFDFIASEELHSRAIIRDRLVFGNVSRFELGKREKFSAPQKNCQSFEEF